MSARKLRYRKDGVKDVPLEQALWQYLLDHARFTQNETFLVNIEIKNYEKFYKSLRARCDGKYRHTEEDLIKKALL